VAQNAGYSRVETATREERVAHIGSWSWTRDERSNHKKIEGKILVWKKELAEDKTKTVNTGERNNLYTSF
jgi:hypothetical protein